MNQTQALALFDLDGTLTRRDTLSDLLIRQFGLRRCLAAGIPLAPLLLGVPGGLVSRDTAKTRVLTAFFGGMPEQEFLAMGERYAEEHLDNLLRPQARERLHWHISEGHRVIVISASVSDWIRPWTDRQGIELLASEAARENGRITGELAGANCRGEEKVRRLRGLLDPSDYQPIYAYGDTDGDTAMLALADHPTYRGLR